MRNTKFRKKSGTISQAVKASAALFFATVITKGIAYITTPLYTRLLSSEEYGSVSVFLTWTNLFGIVAMFCLSYGVFNNGMVDYPDHRDEYSFSMLILSNLITVITCVPLLFLYPIIRQWIGLDRPLLLLMIAIFLLQPAYNFWTNRQRYELKYKATVIWTVFSAIISPLIAMICISCINGNKVYLRLFGAELPLILIYIGFYIYLAFKAKGKVRFKYWKAAVMFNLPIIPHYLSTNLLGSSDKLMISSLVGDTATAHYSVAYSVASIAMIVWTSINASLIPYTYERCKVNDHKSISKVTMPILTVIALLCVVVIMLAPEVVALMATSDYSGAIYVIPPVVGGVFFQVQYFIYANVLYYYKRPAYVMYGSVLSAVLNIILNYIFIQKFGYIAAGYTTLFCYFIQSSLDYVALKKVAGSSIYDMRYLGILSFIVIGISLLSSKTYMYVGIRYIVIAFMIVLTLLCHKRIIGILGKMKGDTKH